MNTQQHDFLAMVSHELRTPLGAIAGWVRLLRSNHLDSAKTAHAFEVIERSIKDQATLIDDIMDMSRMLNGDFRLHTEEIDVMTVLKTCVELLTPVAREKQLQLLIVSAPEALRTVADPVRLQQVLSNLLSNAIKFTGSGGSVLVELHRSVSDLEISITDTGKGIEPEHLPFIFERSFQSERAQNREGGLGFGLAIVKEIVKLHSGSVSVHSDGRGKGSTFTIQLPLRHKPEALQKAPVIDPRRAGYLTGIVGTAA
jgi:Signal transduction histidine kinase